MVQIQKTLVALTFASGSFAFVLPQFFSHPTGTASPPLPTNYKFVKAPEIDNVAGIFKRTPKPDHGDNWMHAPPQKKEEPVQEIEIEARSEEASQEEARSEEPTRVEERSQEERGLPGFPNLPVPTGIFPPGPTGNPFKPGFPFKPWGKRDEEAQEAHAEEARSEEERGLPGFPNLPVPTGIFPPGPTGYPFKPGFPFKPWGKREDEN